MNVEIRKTMCKRWHQAKDEQLAGSLPKLVCQIMIQCNKPGLRSIYSPCSTQVANLKNGILNSTPWSYADSLFGASRRYDAVIEVIRL